VRRVVSNRTVDRGTNTVRRIDPARRATEGMGTRGVASRGTLEAPGAREGAQSILRRSTETGVSRSDVPRYSPSGRVTPRLASQGAGNRPGTTVEGQGGPAGGVDNVRVRGATPGSSRDRVPSLGNNRTGGPSASPGRPQGMTGESPGRAGDPRTSGFARPAGVVPGQAMGRAQRPERVRPAVDSGTGGFATARPGRDMGPFQGRSGRAGDAGMGFHRSPRSGGAAGFSGMPRGGGGSMGAPSPRGGASLGGGPRGGGGPGPGSGPQGGGRGGGGGGRGGMRS
jgi:translation initiation factor IF-2